MSDASSPSQIGRAAPRQKRSHARRDRIVTATRELLCATPAAQITTTLISQHAGIPVSSIYRYFDNVHSIFAYIFEDVSAHLHQNIISVIDDPEHGDNWRRRLSLSLVIIRNAYMDHPYYRPLLGLLSTPEHRSAKETLITNIAEHLSSRWRLGLDGFSGGDPELVARMSVLIILSVEMHLVQEELDSEATDEYLIEAGKLLERYLSPYLGQT